MNLSVDVAVVGGGVIGCSVAYHAARRGARVVLLEAERVGSGASGAAAGMLNAQAEAHEPGPLLNLLLSSRKMHKSLGEELYGLTGLDPEYIWAGTLRVATDATSRKPSPPSTPGTKSKTFPPGGWTPTKPASWKPTSLLTA